MVTGLKAGLCISLLDIRIDSTPAALACADDLLIQLTRLVIQSKRLIGFPERLGDVFIPAVCIQIVKIERFGFVIFPGQEQRLPFEQKDVQLRGHAIEVPERKSFIINNR